MHSAKDKHFRSFRIGTEVLSFADSKAESSSSQHMKIFKEEGSLAPEFDMVRVCQTLFIAVPSQLLKLLVLQHV
jgi:hypothetical protein